jgi:C4-dicarboxylate-binding protein DctP
MKAMKAGVEPRSGGRIKVEIYPANQLGQIPRTVEGVALGTIEATLVASGFFVGLDPRYLVFDAPGLFDDMNHGNRVFQDPDAKRFVDEVGKVTDSILAGMPQVKAEYDALRAAAQKHRR